MATASATAQAIYNDRELICSEEPDLRWDAGHDCWISHYEKEKMILHGNLSYFRDSQYLQKFEKRVKQCCGPQDTRSFLWYKKNIRSNILGLAKIDLNTTNKALQQEADKIAKALASSFQLEKMALLYHYLFYQNRLIWLKKQVEVGLKKHVYYSYQTYKPM